MIAFGNTRYRVPAEIALVIAAAVPCARLLDRWRPPRQDEGVPSDPGSDPVGDGQTSPVSSRVRASNDLESV